MTRRAPQLDLPSIAHVPGSGSVPDMVLLEVAKGLATKVTRAAGWQDNAAYLYGHDLLDAGYFWEAHEVWEVVWLNCPPNSAEKVLLQMLVQRANAELKLNMGRSNASRRLAGQVNALRADLAGRLEAGQHNFMGVDIQTEYALKCS